MVDAVAMIRLGVLADLPAASAVYRAASLSNAGDRDNLLAHPEYLALGPAGLAEGRTYVAEEGGSLVGFATWIEAGGIFELEDLFVAQEWMRRGIAAALVTRIAQVLGARGGERLEVTANPHALGFYRAAGFTDCGVADTDFGAAPRMVLEIRPAPRYPGQAAQESGCTLTREGEPAPGRKPPDRRNAGGQSPPPERWEDHERPDSRR
jgi:GNAT superfamily N-acetyltransferase